MTKSIIVSDLHIGELNHGFIDKDTGLNSRLIDTQKLFEKVVGYAIEEEISNIIIAGDVYNIKNPKNYVRQVFSSVIKTAIDNDIKVFIITGNHDQTSYHQGGHCLSEMQSLSHIIKKLSIFTTPTVKKINEINFAFFPFVNKGEMNILNDADFNKWNKLALKRLADQTEKPSVLICHLETDKSSTHVYEETLGNVIELNFLKNLGFDLIFSGHIHKQQKLAKGIYHTGSLIKTSFNEEGETKFFAVLDHETLNVEFIALDDRDFKTFEIDLTENIDKFKQFERKIKKINLKETITRLVIKIKENDQVSVDVEGLYNYLKENSWKCVGCQKDVVKMNIEETKIDEKHSPGNALKIFVAENSEFFGNDKEECLTRGNKIIEEVIS